MEALAEQRWKLSSNVESRVLADGTSVLKEIKLAEYLSVNPVQKEVLSCFKTERVVGEVLKELLTSGFKISIKEFYDLVAVAHQKGFLQDTSQKLSEIRSVTWKFGWGTGSSWLISSLMIVLGCIALYSWTAELVPGAYFWFISIATLLFSLSFSHLLGGLVLSGCQRTIYRQGLHWTWGIPHWGIDEKDAFMGGRKCEIAVALQRLAGSFVVFGLAWFLKWPTAVWGAFVGCVIQSSPFGSSAMHALIHSAFRKEHQLPRLGSRFLQNRMLPQIFRWQKNLAEERYLVIYSTYAMVWLGATLQWVGWFLNHRGIILFRNLRNTSGWMEEFQAWLILVLIAFIISAPIGFLFWITIKTLWKWIQKKWDLYEQRFESMGTRPHSIDEIAVFLKESLLFSELNEGSLEQIAESMLITSFDPEVMILREGQIGGALCVIYSGSVEILKEQEDGTLCAIARLGKGDVFGEIALVDQTQRTSSVRAIEKSQILILPRASFERLLLEQIGGDRIKTIVQISSFLKKNPLFADWHSKALLSMANTFSFHDVLANQKVISEGQPNDWFYLIYSGRWEVKRQGKREAILKQGDFCGEISLLKGIHATADVIALEESRCLRLHREDFLKFVSQNFLTGYLIESTSEARWKGGS